MPLSPLKQENAGIARICELPSRPIGCWLYRHGSGNKQALMARSDGSVISPKRTLMAHFGRRGYFMRLRTERAARWDALGRGA
jgi:hypothetical protein